MLYIDGYNLIFHLSPSREDLERLREALIEKLSNMEAILVFDAASVNGIGSIGNRSTLRIVYTSHGESADEWILLAIQRNVKPGKDCVVTSDRQLIAKSKALGASIMSPNQFLKSLMKKKAPNVKQLYIGDNAHYLKIFEERFRLLGDLDEFS